MGGRASPERHRAVTAFSECGRNRVDFRLGTPAAEGEAMNTTIRNFTFGILALTTIACGSEPDPQPGVEDDGSETVTSSSAGGGDGEGGAGEGGAGEGGAGAGLPQTVEIPLPFTESFESYGIASVAPFGEWIGDGSIQMTLDEEGLETQVGSANGLVLPGTFGDHRIELDLLTACTYCAVHIQTRSNTVGAFGYELVVGTNYGQLDFALWKEKEGYTKQIAAPPSISGWGADDWAHVRIDLHGGHIRVFFQGDLIADVTDEDNPITEGSLALWGRFDNVKVTALEGIEN